MLTLNRWRRTRHLRDIQSSATCSRSTALRLGCCFIIFSSMVVAGKAHPRQCCELVCRAAVQKSRDDADVARARAQECDVSQHLRRRPYWPILEAQGFTAFGAGQFKAMSVFCAGPRGARVSAVSAETAPGDACRRRNHAAAASCELMVHQSDLHCREASLSVCVLRRSHEWKSTRVPVSFALPHALLVYCRGLEEFVRFAGPLSRFLAWRGMPMVFIESNGPVARPDWQVLGHGSKVLPRSSPAAHRRHRVHGARHVRVMSEEKKRPRIGGAVKESK